MLPIQGPYLPQARRAFQYTYLSTQVPKEDLVQSRIGLHGPHPKENGFTAARRVDTWVYPL